MLLTALGVISASTLGQVTDEAAAARSALLADAESRTSQIAGTNRLLQGGADVRVGGLLQARLVGNRRDVPSGSSAEEVTHGFSIPRARITLDADLNESWSVFFQGDFNPDGGTFTLLDAWADWDVAENWTARAGQFKMPSTRVWQMDDQYGLTADFSVTNAVFSLGRTQGIAAIYESDEFYYVLSFNDGAATANTEFNSGAEADYGLSGRFDWTFAGDRSQLQDIQGWQGGTYAGLLGGFLHYQDGGRTGAGNSGSTVDAALFEALVDMQVEGNGWNAYGALIYQWADIPGSSALNNFGVIAQGGYMVAERNEIFARYDVVIPDSDTPGGSTAFNTITIGWNHFYFPESNASRLTLDIQWYLNATTDNGLVGSLPSIGLLESTEPNQFALRLQHQTIF